MPMRRPDPEDTMTISTRPTSRAWTPAALCVLLLSALVALAAPASAAEDAPAPAPGSGEGWVRLAHYSPDTPAVDVSLTAFSDSRQTISLSDVDYGTISDYQRVPAGTYTASMLPAGAAPGSTPVVTQAVTVEDGKAYTVAAVGANADLTGVVFTDDLTPPAAGESRVRLVQASVSSPTVSVTAAGGPVIAQDAAFGSATGYASIPPGVWTVQLTGASGQPVTTEVTVQPGTVSTLTVLDRGDTLTIEATVDASGVGGQVPEGGVETGGGSTAQAVDPTASPALGALAGGLLLSAGAGAGAVAVARRRPVRASQR
ncbi:DUF4397 domain-containing protein [Modestobacter sp. CPCC 205251]|uniref:DUF4397 domain-containing protein n=1 Tax=Goekera deserti TaxID=2497753 RepID=A0A7K3WHV1_9ACTN|nr:DUF4397 domain-containing protein [Goekera deserti]NEL56058.1 DUF4397 domain-containing protein [Goekera deserti]